MNNAENKIIKRLDKRAKQISEKIARSIFNQSFDITKFKDEQIKEIYLKIFIDSTWEYLNNIENYPEYTKLDHDFDTKMLQSNVSLSKDKIDNNKKIEIIKRLALHNVRFFLSDLTNFRLTCQKELYEVEYCRYLIEFLSFTFKDEIRIFMDFDVFSNKINEMFDTLKDKFDILDYFIRINNRAFQLKTNKELPKMFGEYTEKVKMILDANKIYNTYYVEKKDTYTKEDLIMIEKAYSLLNINDKLKKELLDYLNNKIQEREVKEDKKISLNLPTIDKFKSIEEEKEKLRKELSEVLDLRFNTIFRPLTMNELKRIIFILRRLNYQEEDIKNIILMNESKIYSLSTREKYEYFIEKLDYYKEKFGFVDEIDALKEDYDTFINYGDQVYSEILRDDLENALKLIPRTFEFELK